MIILRGRGGCFKGVEESGALLLEVSDDTKPVKLYRSAQGVKSMHAPLSGCIWVSWRGATGQRRRSPPSFSPKNCFVRGFSTIRELFSQGISCNFNFSFDCSFFFFFFFSVDFKILLYYNRFKLKKMGF